VLTGGGFLGAECRLAPLRLCALRLCGLRLCGLCRFEAFFSRRVRLAAETTPPATCVSSRAVVGAAAGAVVVGCTAVVVAGAAVAPAGTVSVVESGVPLDDPEAVVEVVPVLVADGVVGVSPFALAG
jgi:hypothetical protein